MIRAVVVMATLWLVSGAGERKPRSAAPDRTSSRQTGWQHGFDFDFAFRRQGKPTIPQLTIEAEYSDNRNINDINLSGVVTKSDASIPASISSVGRRVSPYKL